MEQIEIFSCIGVQLSETAEELYTDYGQIDWDLEYISINGFGKRF